MSERPYLGYLHDSDGVHLIGPDGLRDIDDAAAELTEDETPALDVPTIDVDPTSVTDIETGPAELT
ncbi:hypothetical protein B7C42_01669 [Nocardia cerradoensis]|uniref:Uncharacterized protein n=1 Tax=Nocardia cerradoensis TaxID=85688 RepID=A0A231HCQ7_9NOCA|nr:hypothetical protein [Nocardia cerradoensis]OXR46694.1 hypothetical protein B7C42_01669 [Nocardia cerradoensis]